jgi:hypothetical protein
MDRKRERDVLMAHFAEINENNIVIRVLVVDNSLESEGADFLANQLGLGGNWIKTSYNSTIRGTFAGIGYEYNVDEDIFIAPQPFASWIRVGSFWEPPIEMPTDGHDYTWDEETGGWLVIS